MGERWREMFLFAHHKLVPDHVTVKLGKTRLKILWWLPYNLFVMVLWSALVSCEADTDGENSLWKRNKIQEKRDGRRRGEEGGERDRQRFLLLLLQRLQCAAGSLFVRGNTAASPLLTDSRLQPFVSKNQGGG